MLWSPTIRAALLAGTPWLDVFSPGCGTSRAIDLRTVDRHPLASVGTMVLGLRCSWCPGSAPMPAINKHSKQPRKAAITMCEIEIRKQARDARVVDGITVATSLVRERAG